MEPYDVTSWGNLGIAIAFQPFDWQLSVVKNLGDIQFAFGPFTLSFGWPVETD